MNQSSRSGVSLEVMDDWTKLDRPAEGEDVLNATANPKLIQTTEIAASFFEALGMGAFMRLKASKSPVFYVDLGEEPVYTTFVTYLPPDLRSEHLCSICQSFINRYGSFALVRDDGTLEPVLWSTKDLKRRDMQKIYGPSVKAVQQRFGGKKVFKDFNVEQRPGITRLKVLGTITKDKFPHMYVHQPDSRIPRTHSPAFRAATVSEQAAMLDRLLINCDVQTIRKANWMLQNRKIPYAFKYSFSCQWLLDLVEQEKVSRAQGAVGRHNLLYRYSADSFIASRKEVQSNVLHVLLDNIRDNSSWSVLLSEWLWACGRAGFMRHNNTPLKDKIKPADLLFDQYGRRWQFPRHRLCVQDDIPESALMWTSESVRSRGNHAETQASKGQGSEKEGYQADTYSAVDSLEARVSWYDRTKMRNSRDNQSRRVHSPSPRHDPIDISLSDFITRVLPEAKCVAYYHLPWDRLVTFIHGIDDPKPILESDHYDDRASISAYVTLELGDSESRSRDNGECNLKAFDWNEVRCLIPFPDLWDHMPQTVKPSSTISSIEERSDHHQSHNSPRLRYLFVLEDIHACDLCDMPFPQENKPNDMKTGTSEGFVGGVSLDSMNTTNGPAPWFKIVTLGDDTKVYRVRSFG